MPGEKSISTAKRRALNMMAVQIAGDMPGNRADADYVLRRVWKILEENVYCDTTERSDPSEGGSGNVVRLSAASAGDRAS